MLRGIALIHTCWSFWLPYMHCNDLSVNTTIKTFLPILILLMLLPQQYASLVFGKIARINEWLCLASDPLDHLIGWLSIQLRLSRPQIDSRMNIAIILRRLLLHTVD